MARTAPDLLQRDFDPDIPDLTWSPEITFIWMLKGWLFLAPADKSTLLLCSTKPLLSSLSEANRFRGLCPVLEVELRELRDHLEQIHSQAGLRLAKLIDALA